MILFIHTEMSASPGFDNSLVEASIRYLQNTPTENEVLIVDLRKLPLKTTVSVMDNSVFALGDGGITSDQTNTFEHDSAVPALCGVPNDTIDAGGGNDRIKAGEL